MIRGDVDRYSNQDCSDINVNFGHDNKSPNQASITCLLLSCFKDDDINRRNMYTLTPVMLSLLLQNKVVNYLVKAAANITLDKGQSLLEIAAKEVK
jgi:hypothetical protein